MSDKIDKQDIEDVYPMSDIARGMIFHSLEDATGYTYQKQQIYPVKDISFDVGVFKKAFALMVDKHEILRSGFKMFGFEQPVQIVYKKIPLEIPQDDISRLSPGRREEYIKSMLARERQRPFDFTAAEPLWRVKIITKSPGETLLVWICHHALIDGWSSALLLDELTATYAALKKDPGFLPVKLKSSYKDFVLRQVTAAKSKTVQEFWKNELAGLKPLEFPGNYNIETGSTPAAGKKRIRYHLDPAQPGQLRQTAVRFNTGVKELCFAAYLYLLHMLTYDNDMAVGLITNNRPVCEDGDKIIGCFLNTTAVRLKIPTGIRWRDYIYLVTRKLLELKKYELLPFNQVKQIVSRETRDKNPLVETFFNFLDFHVFSEAGPGEEEDLHREFYPETVDYTDTLLEFSLNTTSGRFVLSITYSCSILDHEMVERLSRWYETILAKFSHEAESIMDKQAVLSAEEKQQLLYTWNQTGEETRGTQTIHGLYMDQVEQDPDRVALVGRSILPGQPDQSDKSDKSGLSDSSDSFNSSDLAVTYRELNESAARRAGELREIGVDAETIVGVMLERSIDMVIIMLAILKARGAYLPLDPDTPEERRNYILADSSAPILISDRNFPGTGLTLSFPTHHTHFTHPTQLTQLTQLTPQNLAYLIYTSGTTGRPKGVMVEHGSVIRLVKNPGYIDFRGGQRLIMTAPPVFDIATFEVWGPLLNGIQLYIAGKDLGQDMERLKDAVIKKRISILHLIPHLLSVMLEYWPGVFAGLEYFLVGGDLVKPGPVNRLRNRYPGLKILHCYGPTENTTFSTVARVDKDYDKRLPIGKPIAGTTIYILDLQGQVQPIGVSGELYTGGAGVARGYLNNPGLTMEKFIIFNRSDQSDRSGQSYLTKRIYRTGDLARWQPDGNIEFLGRIDRQVKIRGIRVELAEIENRLLTMPGVREAVVAMAGAEPGDKYLCAYVVMAPGKTFDAGELERYLVQTLPGFMVPLHFVRLETIPLTPTGKILREALPEPGIKPGEEYTPPRNEIEKQLVAVWSGVLGLESADGAQRLGIHDHFFRLGGDSVKSLQVAARMNTMGYKVEITDLLRNTTIAKLAPLVKKKEQENRQPLIMDSEPLTPKPARSLQSDPGYMNLPPGVFLNIENFIKTNIEGNPGICSLYPLSPMQKDMLFHALQAQERARDAYFVQNLFQLEGEIEKNLLENSMNKLVERYDIFRTIFLSHLTAEPLQIVLDRRNLRVDTIDITAPKEEEKTAILQEAMKAEREKGFDLSKDLLIRVTLFKKEEKAYDLMWSSHHILMDGWCLGIIFKEFYHLYRSLKEGKASRLGAVTPYKNYIHWLEKQDKAAGLRYWRAYLGGYDPAGGPGLPKIGSMPGVDNYIREDYTFSIDAALTARMHKLAVEHDVTPNTVFQALWGILLQKYNNSRDVVFGTVVSGRPPGLEGIEHMVGLFINTVPVRITTTPGDSFRQLLEKIREDHLLSRSYEYLPLADILALSPLQANPLDHIMVFENIPLHVEMAETSPDQVGPVHYRVKNEIIFRQTNYDFNIILIPRDSFIIALSYNARVYEKTFIKNVGLHLINILRQVLDKPDHPLAQLEIITPEEKQQILVDFNRTPEKNPQDKTLQFLFAEQVEQGPDRVALIGQSIMSDLPDSSDSSDLAITYRELNERADCLAYVLQEKGVGPDTLVGIMTQRSIGMMVGILGILKAGGAYLPLDPGYPANRLDWVLADSGVKVLVTTGNLGNLAKPGEKVTKWAGEKVLLEEFLKSLKSSTHLLTFSPSNLQNASHLAYVIYTSGSTGKPKGVPVEQTSIVNLLIALNHTYPFTASDTYLLKTSYMFDVSVTELCGWFLGGGRLAILGQKAEKNPELILDAIARHNVTHIDFVPSMFNVFVDYLSRQKNSVKPGMKYIFLAGEVLLPGVVDRYAALKTGTRLENLYGPTEAAVYASSYSLSRWDGRKPIPIGTPMQNIKLYILDTDKNPVPVGITGELSIAGAGLARGYLNNPGLTAEKFIIFNRSDQPDRSDQSYLTRRIYRTGDLARWQPDGNIEFLGRIDHQVKIRGFRVEPGEIENRLLTHRDVKKAVVIAVDTDPGDKAICAYIVTAKGKSPGPRELSEYLGQTLPGYMIPAYFMPVEDIPLTPNGKVDRKALPAPGFKPPADYTAPRDRRERKLAAIWAEVLGIDKNFLSIDTNFAGLGGHSLKATVMAAKIQQEFRLCIPLSQVIDRPTIRKLAQYVKEAKKVAPADRHDPHLVMLRRAAATGRPNPKLFLVHDGTGEIEGYMEFCRQLRVDIDCWGIRADRLNGCAPRCTGIEVTARQYLRAIRTVQPHGPYYLAGWSLGGMIAFEMLRQLEQEHEKVNFCAVIDAMPPSTGPSITPAFTLSSEMQWLEIYLKDLQVREVAGRARSMAQLWSSVIEILEKTGQEKDFIKKLIPDRMSRAIPNLHNLTLRESIYYLNVIRSFRWSGLNYRPGGRVSSTLHLFATGPTFREKREEWQSWAVQPVRAYEIAGDHFSIFQEPHVTSFAGIFSSVIPS